MIIGKPVLLITAVAAFGVLAPSTASANGGAALCTLSNQISSVVLPTLLAQCDFPDQRHCTFKDVQWVSDPGMWVTVRGEYNRSACLDKSKTCNFQLHGSVRLDVVTEQCTETVNFAFGESLHLFWDGGLFKWAFRLGGNATACGGVELPMAGTLVCQYEVRSDTGVLEMTCNLEGFTCEYLPPLLPM